MKEHDKLQLCYACRHCRPHVNVLITSYFSCFIISPSIGAVINLQAHICWNIKDEEIICERALLKKNITSFKMMLQLASHKFTITVTIKVPKTFIWFQIPEFYCFMRQLWQWWEPTWKGISGLFDILWSLNVWNFIWLVVGFRFFSSGWSFLSPVQ